MKSAFIILAMATAGLGATTPAHDAGVARAAIPGQGNVYWHQCGNCKCDASGSREGFSPDSGCLPIDSSIRALGLTRTGTKQTTCAIYTGSNCSGGVAQSVGVGSGTYACTALNQNSNSIRCFYNA
ncbi:hypothetical protein TARUN_10489 [Trichoderma arundinaceum]|uniref:Uncharacterized protein n=1 Tax=Trichoderma arundinaceum TaxID=490622 RepID=A0A395N7W9_TRIAR|nr:hypothetical protein TARUN_10489 [Trichoderma arundinaceum]